MKIQTSVTREVLHEAESEFLNKGESRINTFYVIRRGQILRVSRNYAIASRRTHAITHLTWFTGNLSIYPYSLKS